VNKTLHPEIIKHFQSTNFTTPIIGITGGKGGVGKTSVVVNLAAAVKKKDMEVGIFDADVHGPSVPKMVGV